MALAFCAACRQNVYLVQDEQDTCPVCASGLAETEDAIRIRLGRTRSVDLDAGPFVRAPENA